MTDLEFKECPITGHKLKPEQIKPIYGPLVEYDNPIIGKVKIALSACMELFDGNFERYIIGGICKKRTIYGEEPVLITSDFIREGYKLEIQPKKFAERTHYLLQLLYDTGGENSLEFEFQAFSHCFWAFADPEEFKRIIDRLQEENLIEIRKVHNISGGNRLYLGVKLTRYGREECEKGLPKIPLFGLVSQEITTGDYNVDTKINHARKLFFEQPATLDNMRSACESLSYILEPIRTDLGNFFLKNDVSDFFNIVNNFDIRHNKPHTKDLIHPEQLEWVFYSLLNTINAYSKLKAKVNGIL